MLKLTLIMVTLFSLTTQASEEYTFCENQHSVVTLKEKATKIVIESKNYSTLVSQNDKTVIIVSNPSKIKDKYLPRVEITTESNQVVVLREDKCSKSMVIDLTSSYSAKEESLSKNKNIIIANKDYNK